MNQLNAAEIDYLKELTTICAGHAANRIAKILPFPVMITHPIVTIKPLPNLKTEHLNNDFDSIIIIIVKGDFKATMILSFSEDTPAIFLKHSSLKISPSHVDYEGFLSSIILELGNILSSAYATALEKFTGLFLMPSVPKFLKKDNISEEVIFDQLSSEIPFIQMKTEFYIPSFSKKTRFLTILSLKEGRKILKIGRYNYVFKFEETDF